MQAQHGKIKKPEKNKEKMNSPCCGMPKWTNTVNLENCATLKSNCVYCALCPQEEFFNYWIVSAVGWWNSFCTERMTLRLSMGWSHSKQNEKHPVLCPTKGKMVENSKPLLENLNAKTIFPSDKWNQAFFFEQQKEKMFWITKSV